MAEWFNASVSKTGGVFTHPWVRIPLLPPHKYTRRGRIAGRVQRFAKPPNRVTCSEGSNPSLSAILIYGIVLKWLESSLQNCYTSVRIRPMPPNIQKTRMIIRVFFCKIFSKNSNLYIRKLLKGVTKCLLNVKIVVAKCRMI